MVTAAAAPPASGPPLRPAFPWLNQIATEPFYLLHLLVFSSYFAARSSASDRSPGVLLREIQGILTFLVLLAVKMVKEETWEGLIADSLFYAKGILFAVALFISHQLAFFYLLAFLVVYALTQQPPYEGLGDSYQLTPLQLESILVEGNSSRFWLVEFRSLCSSKCIRTSRVFPNLSTIYSNKTISFGIVDLGHFPNAAGNFGVNLSGLPTYVLFDNGVEVARLPEINGEAKGAVPVITKNIVCRHFELDRRLAEYIST